MKSPAGMSPYAPPTTNRGAKVDELKGAIIFLAAPASDFVSGQMLYVDGEMTAGV